jgi:hypothetical protein
MSGSAVYVVIPPSPLFAAHWSFFVPYPSPPSDSERRGVRESRIGRRIHVSGDRLNGFKLEIIRSYDVGKHRSVGADRQFRIGVLSLPSAQDSTTESGSLGTDTLIGNNGETKDEEDGGGFVDNSPRDPFEQICTDIDAPGPSLNKVSFSSGNAVTHAGKRIKPEVRDCQWWIRQVMRAMIDRGMLVKAEGDERSPTDWLTLLPMH